MSIFDLLTRSVPPLDKTILLWMRGEWSIGQVFISRKGKRLFTNGGFQVGPKALWILLPKLTMTIDDPEAIYKLIRDKGHYPDDPPVYKIYTYTDLNDKKTYSIYYRDYELEASHYVRDPVLLWEDGDLTADGKVEFIRLRNQYGSTR